ncbi:hypothetical protein ABIE67_001557 [Streptomyces sp. V4I8]
MSDPRILTVRPRPGEYAWTFGGAPPVARIATGSARPSQDAYQFAPRAVESPPVNVCDTNYTCVAKIRKEWLPARDTHRGVHARPRERRRRCAEPPADLTPERQSPSWNAKDHAAPADGDFSKAPHSQPSPMPSSPNGGPAHMSLDRTTRSPSGGRRPQRTTRRRTVL